MSDSLKKNSQEEQQLHMWGEKRYHSLDYEMKKRYGEKVYKLALDGGFTCPNRDGTIDTRGCIFCSEGGSGDFAMSRAFSITEQIERAKTLVSEKSRSNMYIAYFQAYTGTYGPVSHLREIYEEAIAHPDIVAVSIATRPDCLDEEVLDLLEEWNRIKPVWVELGLQTIHPETAQYIRRGYELNVFDEAVDRLSERGIEIIVHGILGLPGESAEDMIDTARYISHKPISGVKFQLLHVLENTDLCKDYMAGKFEVLSLEEYTDILIRCIELMPENVVIHRLTGDGPKKILVAPKWSGDKKKVLNYINHRFKEMGIWQGKTLAAYIT